MHDTQSNWPAYACRILHRIQLENDLRHAISRDQFRILYQPIVAMKTGCVEGFEAMVCWMHPEHGPIAEDKFIPLAEQMGLIDLIEEFLLQKSVTQLSLLHRKFPESLPFITAKLSTHSLRNAMLVPWIATALGQQGSLRIEAPHYVFTESAETSRPMLSDLKSLGVNIAIGDFAAGQTSFRSLRNFPIRHVKIDRAFAPTFASNAKILQEAINLAHRLAMTVVTNGIETVQECVLLQSMGCDFGIGRFLSPPVPGELLGVIMSMETKLKQAA